ncbi:MAG: 4Fe-4S binding protein, partial [Defluviitaleaceae bacterium]|nr:4Fe-4S binding protein [Defluviitaleaceae bacterium]
KPRGYFSLGAVGVDYHITLRAILKDLDALLRRKGFVFDSHISVDTGPLPEKLLAVKAGLGFIGKNGLCISDAFGSFFNIGYMITTLRIEPWHSTNTESCGECDRCVMACPGGALDGVYDFTRCISYLTQKKEEPGVSERRLMGLCLYGCDICQKACPYNANTYVGKIESQDYIAPELSELLALTKKDFDFKYKSTAIYWRGLENLKRNAAIALENYNVEGES